MTPRQWYNKRIVTVPDLLQLTQEEMEAIVADPARTDLAIMTAEYNRRSRVRRKMREEAKKGIITEL